MIQPGVDGFSSNVFEESAGAFNDIYKENENQTDAEKVRFGAYDDDGFPTSSGNGSCYDKATASNNNDNNNDQISGKIDNVYGKTSMSEIEINTDPLPNGSIDDNSNNNNKETTESTTKKKGEEEELTKEEKSFRSGFWHPMKCYTHSLLSWNGTRFYIHWTLPILAIVHLILSMSWPGNWPTVHLWVAFRIIAPLLYIVNLFLISLVAMSFTNCKFNGKHYYFVLFCFGIFNRLKTDIQDFGPRMQYYLVVPFLHILFGSVWWILASLSADTSLVWTIDDLENDFGSKVLIYQRNLNIFCLMMALLPMPSTFGGCIYASLLQYYRGWSVTKACILLVFLSVVCLVVITFLWISNFSSIEFLFIVIWSSWQLLEFVFKGKESSGMKSMILTGIAKQAVKEQMNQMHKNSTTVKDVPKETELTDKNKTNIYNNQIDSNNAWASQPSTEEIPVNMG